MVLAAKGKKRNFFSTLPERINCCILDKHRQKGIVEKSIKYKNHLTTIRGVFFGSKSSKTGSSSGYCHKRKPYQFHLS